MVWSELANVIVAGSEALCVWANCVVDTAPTKAGAAIADGTLHAYRTCDWIDNAIVLQMSPAEGEVYGYVHLACRVELNRSLTGRGVLPQAEPAVG